MRLTLGPMGRPIISFPLIGEAKGEGVTNLRATSGGTGCRGEPHARLRQAWPSTETGWV